MTEKLCIQIDFVLLQNDHLFQDGHHMDKEMIIQ